WAYIDLGRWDDALEAAAEAADLAEANHMELVAGAADLIAATVLALRTDSAAARRRADPVLAHADLAGSGLLAARARRALGGAALADGSHLQAFHPAAPTVQRGRRARPQHLLLPGRSRSRHCRGPRRPADGRTRRPGAGAQPSRRTGFSPAEPAHRPGAGHSRRPGRGRSPFRQGAL